MTNSELIQQPQGREVSQAASDDLYSQFINYIDASVNTIKTYTRSLHQWQHWTAEHNIKQPQREDVLAFKDYLIKTGHKATTIQNYIIALRQFFNWTEVQHLYPNIARGIKGAKTSSGFKKDYLLPRQANQVLKDIDTSTLRGKRDFAIDSLMLTGGLRTVEVSRANVEDLRPEGGVTVLFLQGKGRDDRNEYVKVAPHVEDAIRAYLKERGPVKANDPLFASLSNNNHGGRMTTRSISGIAKDSMKAAGYDSSRLTAHSFRHTAATINLMQGGTLEETQQLLRHRSINTTMIYAQNLKRAANKSEGRIEDAIFNS